MKILVCIKQVPDTTDIKIDPVTNTLKRDGVPSIINPDDKTALEAALVLKGQYDAQVVVLTMGPPQAEYVLREALAMGADQAYLLTDRMFAGSDTLATGTIIAAGIKQIGCDFVLAGRQAIDGDTAQVGPQIAERLNWPQITYCAQLTKKGEEFYFVRQIEDRQQILKAKPPFVVTVLGSMAKPRYMSVTGIVNQEQKQINTITFADLKLDVKSVGLQGSPTRVNSTYTKQFNGDKTQVELPPSQAAELIADQLFKNNYLG